MVEGKNRAQEVVEDRVGRPTGDATKEGGVERPTGDATKEGGVGRPTGENEVIDWRRADQELHRIARERARLDQELQLLLGRISRWKKG